MTRRSMMVAVATLLVGCAGGTAMEEIGEGSSRIIDGKASNRESVVLLVHFGEQTTSRCTGTMIAKNLVLTARHCVSKVTNHQVASNYEAEDIFVFTGIDAPKASTSRAAAAARGSQSVVYTSATTTGQDVALIVLDQDVNVPIAKLADDAPEEGEKLTAVGYGLTEDNVRATERRERTNLTVLANAGPLFQVGEAACYGDSGGPAMRTGNVVVGVQQSVQEGDGVGRSALCVGADAKTNYTSVASASDLVAAGRKAAAEARAAQP